MTMLKQTQRRRPVTLQSSFKKSKRQNVLLVHKIVVIILLIVTMKLPYGSALSMSPPVQVIRYRRPWCCTLHRPRYGWRRHDDSDHGTSSCCSCSSRGREEQINEDDEDYNNNNNNNNYDNSGGEKEESLSFLSMEQLSLERFKRRRESLERKAFQNQWQRPPNPFLSPTDLIRCLLETLKTEKQPPQQQQQQQRQATSISSLSSLQGGGKGGVLALLECSTPTWRRTLLSSIGAPRSATNEQVASTLDAALRRPNNQFAILMGSENPYYQIDFPTDPVEYGDGTCWVECRLREDVVESSSSSFATTTTMTTTSTTHTPTGTSAMSSSSSSSSSSSNNDELLVVLGWSLEQRPSDGAWMVAALDWQDFRPPYRPGIGREEWERICG